MHFSSSEFYERKDNMGSSTTEWYAVILITATENPLEPSENRYTTHTKAIAIHKDEMVIKEYACELSEDYGLPYRDSAKELISDPHDCVGRMILSTDRYNLDPETVKDYATRHCILGRNDFKLQMPKSLP